MESTRGKGEDVNLDFPCLWLHNLGPPQILVFYLTLWVPKCYNPFCIHRRFYARDVNPKPYRILECVRDGDVILDELWKGFNNGNEVHIAITAGLSPHCIPYISRVQTSPHLANRRCISLFPLAVAFSASVSKIGQHIAHPHSHFIPKVTSWKG